MSGEFEGAQPLLQPKQQFHTDQDAFAHGRSLALSCGKRINGSGLHECLKAVMRALHGGWVVVEGSGSKLTQRVIGDELWKVGVGLGRACQRVALFKVGGEGDLREVDLAIEFGGRKVGGVRIDDVVASRVVDPVPGGEGLPADDAQQIVVVLKAVGFVRGHVAKDAFGDGRIPLGVLIDERELLPVELRR